MTRKATFDNVTTWKKGFLEHTGPAEPEKFPFVLIGNKCDKEDERQVSKEAA